MPAASNARKFVFSATTGRSGTGYLAELLRRNLPDATVHHERTGYLSFGIDTPDTSHFTQFNSAGNVRPVREFWQRKHARLRAETGVWYVETSHLLLKAGLLENIGPLTEAGEVSIVVLTRDVADTVISFVERHDFANSGFTWLWTLDPRYPNKITAPGPLLDLGAAGAALWYVIEMRTRGEFYKLLLDGVKNLRFIDASLSDIAQPAGAARMLAALGGRAKAATPVMPGRVNETRAPRLPPKARDQLRRMVERTQFDPVTLAGAFYESGKRLGDGHAVWRARFEKLGSRSV